MTAFVAAAAGLCGLAIGSFLNVVIYRVPLRMSLVRPPSRCPRCETPIKPRDNIPVLGWLVLRGRCRACGLPISPRYPLIEALTAGLFVAAAFRVTGLLAVLPYCAGFGGLIALAFIDLDTKLLPKRVVWPATAMVLAAFVATAAVHDTWHPLVRALLGAGVSSGALGLIWFVYPRGMGFGDVRLEVLLGLLLGWVSRGTVLAGFLLAFLLGGVLSIVLLATGVRSRKDTIPFGPWLCLGCVIALLWPATGRWVERNEIRPTVDVVKTVF